MKKSLLILLMVLLLTSAYAQRWTSMSQSATKEVVGHITKQMKIVNDMTGRFVQTKHSELLTEDVISEGIFHYTKPNIMSWEYTSPIQYKVEVRDDSISIQRDGKTITSSRSQKRMIKGLMKIVIGISSGNNLFDERNFIISFHESRDLYRATLVPQGSNMKRMFTQIDLFFDKKNYQIIKLLISESNKSVTTIEFKSIETK